MWKPTTALAAALLALLLSGCDQTTTASAPSASTATPTTAKPTATKSATKAATKPHEPPQMPALPTDLGHHDQAVRYLLDRLVKPKANYAVISKQLRPKEGDYALVFVGAAAAQAKARYEAQFDAEPFVVKPQKGQTEYLVWGATTEELQSGEGDADKFPDGYRKIASKLKPGLTFYGFKFVEPGKTVGTSYDGLVFVESHWAIFPKPYSVLR